jgi:hypothetical protein
MCAKVCAGQNERLDVSRKLLKILVPANGFEPLTPRFMKSPSRQIRKYCCLGSCTTNNFEDFTSLPFVYSPSIRFALFLDTNWTQKGGVNPSVENVLTGV